jgi:hypothetical protein
MMSDNIAAGEHYSWGQILRLGAPGAALAAGIYLVVAFTIGEPYGLSDSPYPIVVTVSGLMYFVFMTFMAPKPLSIERWAVAIALAVGGALVVWWVGPMLIAGSNIINHSADLTIGFVWSLPCTRALVAPKGRRTPDYPDNN